MGVRTCTTPAASFSINIPGPTSEPEIGQRNYWAAIIAGARCNGKPFLQNSQYISRIAGLASTLQVRLREFCYEKCPETGSTVGASDQIATSGRISIGGI